MAATTRLKQDRTLIDKKDFATRTVEERIHVLAYNFGRFMIFLGFSEAAADHAGLSSCLLEYDAVRPLVAVTSGDLNLSFLPLASSVASRPANFFRVLLTQLGHFDRQNLVPALVDPR